MRVRPWLERVTLGLGLGLIAWAAVAPSLMPHAPVCGTSWRCLVPQEGELEFSDSGDAEGWEFDAGSASDPAEDRSSYSVEFQSAEDETQAVEGRVNGLFWYGELVALELSGDRKTTSNWGYGADYPKVAFALGLALSFVGGWFLARRRSSAYAAR